MNKDTINKEDFIKYFKSHDVGKLAINLFREHYLASGKAATAGELAKAVGYKGHGAVNLTYGILAGKIIDNWEENNRFSKKELLNSLIKTGVLWKGTAEINPNLSIFMKKFVHDKNWIFYMSDELAEAIEEMGWIGKSNRSKISVNQEDPNDPISYEEGGVKYKTVKQYERSTKARRACISKNGNSCAVCGLSFGEKFGKDFYDLIVVHHTNPMAAKKTRKTDPVNDLKPLCPNCHAMAHYGLPGNSPRTIDQLKMIIKK